MQRDIILWADSYAECRIDCLVERRFIMLCYIACYFRDTIHMLCTQVITLWARDRFIVCTYLKTVHSLASPDLSLQHSGSARELNTASLLQSAAGMTYMCRQTWK